MNLVSKNKKENNLDNVLLPRKEGKRGLGRLA